MVTNEWIESVTGLIVKIVEHGKHYMWSCAHHVTDILQNILQSMRLRWRKMVYNK